MGSAKVICFSRRWRFPEQGISDNRHVEPEQNRQTPVYLPFPRGEPLHVDVLIELVNAKCTVEWAILQPPVFSIATSNAC